MFNKRWWKFRWQKLTRGWNDSDTWNLDHTIAEFVLPRIKRFKEITISYPGHLDKDSWNKILDQMIFSFEAILNEWNLNEPKMTVEERKEYDKKVQEGLDLFGKYFRDLWD